MCLAVIFKRKHPLSVLALQSRNICGSGGRKGFDTDGLPPFTSGQLHFVLIERGRSRIDSVADFLGQTKVNSILPKKSAYHNEADIP